MDEADLVRVHEAWIAHHVAAVGQINREHRSAAILHRRRTMVDAASRRCARDVAAREYFFEMLGEFGVDRHHVFEVAVLRAILDHQDLAVALDDLSLDLADFFVQQNFVGQLAIENLLTDFRHTLRTERVRGARPAERRLRFFVGLEQRLVGPLRRGRRIRLDAVKRSNTAHVPLAATVTAFSTYLIGLCMSSLSMFGRLTWRRIRSLSAISCSQRGSGKKVTTNHVTSD